MRNIAILIVAAGALGLGASAQMHTPSQVQDERELRSFEAATAKSEQLNDASTMDLFADNWVCLGKKVLTKTDFQEAVKRNFVSHGNGPNPYTIEKKNMRVDLFGDTAVVTYIKEYRQIPDSSRFFDEDDTDVFIRGPQGWKLQLTKISPVQPEPKLN